MLLYSPHYLFKRDVITVIASFEPPQSKKLSFSFRIPCLYFSFERTSVTASFNVCTLTFSFNNRCAASSSVNLCAIIGWSLSCGMMTNGTLKYLALLSHSLHFNALNNHTVIITVNLPLIVLIYLLL